MKLSRSAMMTAVICSSIVCCSKSPSTSTVEKPAAVGKGDFDFNQKLCSAIGLPSYCDACAIQGWYTDGVCDTFCLHPDPECPSDICEARDWYGDGICDTVCDKPDPDCSPICDDDAGTPVTDAGVGCGQPPAGCIPVIEQPTCLIPVGALLCETHVCRCGDWVYEDTARCDGSDAGVPSFDGAIDPE